MGVTIVLFLMSASQVCFVPLLHGRGHLGSVELHVFVYFHQGYFGYNMDSMQLFHILMFVLLYVAFFTFELMLLGGVYV